MPVFSDLATGALSSGALYERALPVKLDIEIETADGQDIDAILYAKIMTEMVTRQAPQRHHQHHLQSAAPIQKPIRRDGKWRPLVMPRILLTLV